MKVLVVEDDPRISDVLEYALKAEGYEVQAAQRGREAIELAKSSCPTLFVLDVGLPDIDGFEVCRTLRTFSMNSCPLPLPLERRTQSASEGTGVGFGRWLG